MCTLWYTYVTRCGRSLVLMLSKSCAIIVIGIQLVRYNVIQSRSEYQYVNTWQNAIFFMSTCFIMFCSHAISLYVLILLWQRWLLTYMQHTRRLTHTQHMKCYSFASYYYAAHKVCMDHVQCIKYRLHAVHEDYLCAAHCVSHMSLTESLNKNWRTHVYSPHMSVNSDLSCTV